MYIKFGRLLNVKKKKKKGIIKERRKKNLETVGEASFSALLSKHFMEPVQLNLLSQSSLQLNL